MDKNAPPKSVLKYNENKYLDEALEYIEGTYRKHYSSNKQGVQTFDLILATGHAPSFCIGNILKYASRLGKKDGWNKDDIKKMIHYALLLSFSIDE